MNELYQVDIPKLNNACFGLVVDSETQKVIEAANIAWWTVGKHISYVKKYYEKKGGTVSLVSY